MEFKDEILPPVSEELPNEDLPPNRHFQKPLPPVPAIPQSFSKAEPAKLSANDGSRNSPQSNYPLTTSVGSHAPEDWITCVSLLSFFFFFFFFCGCSSPEHVHFGGHRMRQTPSSSRHMLRIQRNSSGIMSYRFTEGKQKLGASPFPKAFLLTP